ncbi:DUF2304 family protein [Heliobacillus mobilis]|uniref:DUF2304 family protein n=1 Tax=Heliobacterium mobile TaxID=28064 RepID=A0A6I3SML6_HELMO|nr:DUF2304 domain-containing protein [Heliobacterium mobile]MTV49975.1 DUF2304 family protein [Heliobacterium mobile]
MELTVYNYATVISVIFLGFVLEMVRRYSLKEQYSILWLLVAALMLLLSLKHELLEWIAQALGIYYAPAALFFFGLIFCFSLILHFSVIISKLDSKHTRVVQEVALLNQRIRELEERMADTQPNPRKGA